MKARSLTYIAIKPGAIPFKPLTDFLNKESIAESDNGTLIIYESSYAPTWARADGDVAEQKDLDDEIKLHRLLDLLPSDSFYMKRVGENCNWSGVWCGHWNDHPFKDHKDVVSVEALFEAKRIDTNDNVASYKTASDETISVPRHLLASLIDIAYKHINDIEDDISNGLRQESDNEDLDEKRQAVDEVDTLYREATLGGSASPGM